MRHTSCKLRDSIGVKACYSIQRYLLDALLIEVWETCGDRGHTSDSDVSRVYLSKLQGAIDVKQPTQSEKRK